MLSFADSMTPQGWPDNGVNSFKSTECWTITRQRNESVASDSLAGSLDRAHVTDINQAYG
eukprot:CAMPEP_0113249314 /NCGR_PEP_ID=MMETSP0008_2-20120614/10987_1 /TAXON_ID=97485 /ORGANISM="Prymnesium parvum" /LENGTH=59 /DNA_ID=CAMNT_0000097227 /DNA_START=1 /DNA_END=180 /DNA_ORIENTATION=- /assembly_acc=CAM_ASM_000153